MKNRYLSPLFELVILALVLVLPTATPALAQDETVEVAAPEPGSYARGFAIFQRYCRSCHGKDARGEGPVAKFLKIPPTDLTRLAAANGGEFPTEEALSQVDSRAEMVPIHNRDMPIWGSVFQVDEGESETDVQRKLADLIAYLQGIQVADPAPEGD